MADYQHVLIAVDFSSACQKVLDKGIDIANKYHSKITLAHIVEYLPPLDFANEPITTPDWVMNEEALVKNAETSMKKLVEDNQLSDANTTVLVGTPKNEIVRLAEELATDLIVIGSHGRHGISRLLGSTAYPVLHHAKCDVLAIRIQD